MDLGCKTWHHTLTCLKMSSKLLIYHADSLHSDNNVTLMQRRVRAASHYGNFQILLRFISFGTCTNHTMRISMTWAERGMHGTWLA